MPISVSIQQRLLALTAGSVAKRELAYVLAGFLVTFRVLRSSQVSRPLTGAGLGIAVLILVGVMLLAGPVLGAMAPLFLALGHLPGSALTLAVLLLVVLRFRRLGRLHLTSL